METAAIYMFCLARSGLLPELCRVGLDGDAPLVTQNIENVTAVVCEVSLEEFHGPSAEARFQDLAWVSQRAVRHGEIIDEAMQYSPVLPARFGTLFSSADRLKQLVKRNINEINCFLDLVTDKDEWAVKVLLSRSEVRERLFSERLSGQSEAFDSMSQGLRYFKERQIKVEVEKEIGGWMKTVLTAAATTLTDCATDWRQRAFGIGAEEEGNVERVANWAFLVDRGTAQDFRSRIAGANSAHNSYGILFDVSGPWPPYSFTPELKMEAE